MGKTLRVTVKQNQLIKNPLKKNSKMYGNTIA